MNRAIGVAIGNRVGEPRENGAAVDGEQITTTVQVARDRGGHGYRQASRNHGVSRARGVCFTVWRPEGRLLLLGGGRGLVGARDDVGTAVLDDLQEPGRQLVRELPAERPEPLAVFQSVRALEHIGVQLVQDHPD